MPLALLVALLLNDTVNVTVTTTPYNKGGSPSVNIDIIQKIAGFRLVLVRDDGKKIDVKGGGKPGQKRVIELPQPEGKFSWKGELSINNMDGSVGSMPMEFDTAVWGPLRLTAKKEDVDLTGRKMRFSTNRPIVKAELKVLMDTGKTAFDDEIAFTAEQEPGKPLDVTWPEASGRVMMLWLKVFDSTGQFNGVEFSSWYIEIPHEEVQFDTGKADVRDSEVEKLDKSYKLIAEAVFKYGSLADIKLYVAGHTDTVAAKDFNRTLSLSRARSIGGYFRKKGLRIPIFAEGFGEEALKVVTADETDEQQNRRADYFISIDAPTVTNASFAPKWQRL